MRGERERERRSERKRGVWGRREGEGGAERKRGVWRKREGERGGYGERERKREFITLSTNCVLFSSHQGTLKQGSVYGKI